VGPDHRVQKEATWDRTGFGDRLARRVAEILEPIKDA